MAVPLSAQHGNVWPGVRRVPPYSSLAPTHRSLQYSALEIPKNSPLRGSYSLFWGVRTTDEGTPRPGGFHALVNAGKIDLVAPARAAGYSADGTSVVLTDGHTVKADAVILATGYNSSWSGIFDRECRISTPLAAGVNAFVHTQETTMDELGLSRHPPGRLSFSEWDYQSLKNPPRAHPDNEQWASSIYRGIVPAKNILRRDFAVNGASVCS